MYELYIQKRIKKVHPSYHSEIIMALVETFVEKTFVGFLDCVAVNAFLVYYLAITCHRENLSIPVPG